MNKIDLSTSATQARTLPSAGKVVNFYDNEGHAFIGVMELNRWFRPTFFAIRYGNRYRLNFIPIGWDELETTGNADEDAGAYADMPAMKEAA